MDIDVSISSESLSITIDNPYKVNISQVKDSILGFGNKFGIDLAPYEIDKLIPRMIRGVAGCEGGCPSDAKSLVHEGFMDFNLTYIEGGILTASQTLENGEPLQVRIFPDFD